MALQIIGTSESFSTLFATMARFSLASRSTQQGPVVEFQAAKIRIFPLQQQHKVVDLARRFLNQTYTVFVVLE